MEAKFSDSKAPLKKVVGIQFSALSAKQIEDISVTKQFSDASGTKKPAGIFEVNNVYDPVTKKPLLGGLSDLRMGNTVSVEDCGYFGHMNLVRPVYHHGYLNAVLEILRSVSYYTSELLVSEHDISQLSKSCRKKKRLKEISKMSQKIKICPKTGLGLPMYKKEGLKIVVAHTNPNLQEVESDTIGVGGESGNGSGKPKYFTLKTTEAYRILEMISDRDAKTLGLNPEFCRPENMMIKTLPVPPPHVRPNILMSSSQRCEDDISHKLTNIARANVDLKKVIDNNSEKHTIEAFENKLQYHISTYFDNKIPGQKPDQQRSGKPLKTLRQRLVGKEGRVRGNLMGKRVDFSARTVITGDPNLSIDQVGVPVSIAKNLTVPDKVNQYNIEKLQKLVDNGPNKHPGAKYVIITHENGRPKKLDLSRAKNRVVIREGNIVERHLDNDDVVLFNRQPSLHRMSIMAHRVVVQQGLTFRINLSVCAPYNADFDGDEMNLHVPQSLAARVEAEELMKVEKQIISPQSNKPVMGIIQDALLSVSLLTRRNVFFEKHDVQNIVMSMNQVSDALDTVYEPEAFLYINTSKYHSSTNIKKEDDCNKDTGNKFYRLWSGKQLFSCCIQDLTGLKFERKSMECPDSEDNFAENDRRVLIQNGQLLRGIIDKNTIGAMEGSLIHIISLDYGHNKIKNFMNRIQRLANYWIMRRSFSIGIADTIVSRETKHAVKDIINDVKERVLSLVNGKQFSAVRLERDILSELNGARDKAGHLAQSELTYKNNFKNTVACGSKGNVLNISQISSVVGQQNIEGKRVIQDFTNRTLPHYQPDDQSTMDIDHETASKGFVENSYFSGLNPQEFFFHAKAGREGIIDTACKSVTRDTELLICLNDGMKIVKIGDWIDDLLEKNEDDIVEKHNTPFENYVDVSEILEIGAMSGNKEPVYIHNADAEGQMYFTPITQVVRHKPGQHIFNVYTKSGRKVSVIDSESLIVWNNDTCLFEPKKTSLVTVGAYLPTVLKIDNMLSTDMQRQLYDNRQNFAGTVFGTDFNDGLFVAVCMMFGTLIGDGHIVFGNRNENTGFSMTFGPELLTFVTEYFISKGTYVYNGVEVENSKNQSSFKADWFSANMECLRQWKQNPFIGTINTEEFISGLFVGIVNSYKKLHGIEIVLYPTFIDDTEHTDIEIRVPRSEDSMVKVLIHYAARLGLLSEMFEGLYYTYIGFTKRTDVYKKYSVSEDVILDPIVRIEKCVPENGIHDYVYDITVPGTYNFCLANGLCVRDTSDTGYLQRKLVKAQEDLIIKYDYSVRDSYNNIVQFVYGEDGINASYIEQQEFLINCSDTEFNNRFVDNDHGSVIEEEITQLKLDREFGRKVVNSMFYPGEKIAEKTIYLPVGLKRILDRVIVDILPSSEKDLVMSHQEIYSVVKSFIEGFNYGPNKETVKLFKMHLRSYLASKRLHDLKINDTQLKLIMSMIIEGYKSSLAVPGEMCGVIAAQSLSGPLTQMTLNSVDYNTVLMIDWTGDEMPPCRPNEPVGKFIDALIEKYPKECQLQQDGHTIWLPLKRGSAKALSCDSDGNMIWTELEAVTKHLPVNKDGTKTLLKVTTKSGRSAICTKGKSFLIYDSGQKKIVDCEGYDLKVGDKIPVVNQLRPEAFRKTIDVVTILSPKEHVFTDYMIEAKKVMNDFDIKYAGINGGRSPWFHEIKDKVPYNRSDSLRVCFEQIHCFDNARSRSLFTPGRVFPKSWCSYMKEDETFIGIPRIIELDRDFGFLIGAYLSEGCTTKFQVCIANNNETFRKMATRWTDDNGITNRLNSKNYSEGEDKTKRHYQDGTSICIHSTILRHLLVEICGSGSYEKRVPEFAFSAPDIFVEGLLDGYLCGDACVSEKGSVIFGSRSIKLRDGITTLLSRFEIVPNVSMHMEVNKKDKNDPSGESKPMYNTCCSTYDIDKFQTIITAIDYKQERVKINTIRQQTNKRNNRFIKEKFCDTFLDEVVLIEEIDPPTEYVYDLTVEGTRNMSSINGLQYADSFHSSGLAHSITLGVPRIKELIHISKNIKSPCLTIFPKENYDIESLKNQLEYKTFRSFIKKSFVCRREFLGDTTNTFDTYRQFDTQNTIYDFVNKIIISNEVLEYTGITMIKLLSFVINDRKIREDLLENINIEFSDDNVPEPFIVISIKKKFESNTDNDSKKSDIDYEDHEITTMLKDIEVSYINKIKVQGLQNVSRVFINEKNRNVWNEDSKSFVESKKKYIETEGSNLMGSFTIPGIDHTKTFTNNVIEVYEVLGIEAARKVLLNEFKYVLSADGSYINYRHLALLVDVITNVGTLCPLNRHGMGKNNVNNSVLGRSSFEETCDILLEGATYSQRDIIKGITENIMLGQMAPCGTGSFNVLLDHDKYIEEIEIVEDYRPPSPTMPEWL